MSGKGSSSSQNSDPGSRKGSVTDSRPVTPDVSNEKPGVEAAKSIKAKLDERASRSRPMFGPDAFADITSKWGQGRKSRRRKGKKTHRRKRQTRRRR